MNPPRPNVAPAATVPFVDDPRESPILQALAALMPWTVSVVVHLAVFLALMFFSFVMVRGELPGMAGDIDETRLAIDTPAANDFKDPTYNPRNDDDALGSPLITSNPFVAGFGQGKDHGKHALGDLNGLIDGNEKPAGLGGPVTDVMTIGIVTNDPNAASGGGGPAGRGPRIGVPFGDPNGGGPGSKFYGVRTGRKAMTIVYVVDASGSMLRNFDFVKLELLSSVGKLAAKQQFSVILFADGPTREFKPALTHATKPTLKELKEWAAGQQPGNWAGSGSTDPTRALEKAFKLNPDVIYFLTDGLFDRGVVEKVRKWQAAAPAKARVHTLAFVDNVGEPLMKEISQATGGEYRFVKEEDLGN